MVTFVLFKKNFLYFLARKAKYSVALGSLPRRPLIAVSSVDAR
jgi:hypothetical protein